MEQSQLKSQKETSTQYRISSQPQKPGNLQRKELVNNLKGVYVEQTSPENPFGPNYKVLPLSTKITYKFSMMKNYFKMTPQDNKHKEFQEQKFIGTLILGLVGGYFCAQIPLLMVQKIKKTRMRRGLPTILSTCCLSSYAYIKANQRYYEQIPKKFINKYLPEAIQNGFVDYEISSN